MSYMKEVPPLPLLPLALHKVIQEEAAAGHCDSTVVDAKMMVSPGPAAPCGPTVLLPWPECDGLLLRPDGLV